MFNVIGIVACDMFSYRLSIEAVYKGGNYSHVNKLMRVFTVWPRDDKYSHTGE